MNTDYGVLGHKVATEAIKRIKTNKALGTPSFYNIIRESAIDVLEQETVESAH